MYDNIYVSVSNKYYETGGKTLKISRNDHTLGFYSRMVESYYGQFRKMI